MTIKAQTDEPDRIWDDQTALNQIAAILGLYTTNPAGNPVQDVIDSIIDYVRFTGRRTDVPQGA